jgi:hypothetical protein
LGRRRPGLGSSPVSTVSLQACSNSGGTYLSFLFFRAHSLSTVEPSYCSGASPSIATRCSNVLAPPGVIASGVDLVQLRLRRRFGIRASHFCRPQWLWVCRDNERVGASIVVSVARPLPNGQRQNHFVSSHLTRAELKHGSSLCWLCRNHLIDPFGPRLPVSNDSAGL